MLRPKEVVCKWVDAFNNHDVEAIVSLYHDNATNHQVTNEVDDPPKIAGRYTKGAECSAGWLLWNSVCQSIAELTSY